MPASNVNPSIQRKLGLLATAWPKLSRLTIVGRQSTEAENEQYEKLFWAAQAMTRLIERRPVVALQVIETICWSTSDQEVLEHLGAGPLEDLLSENNPAITAAVEHRAKTDVRFSFLLSRVWRNQMNDATWERVTLAKEDLLRI